MQIDLLQEITQSPRILSEVDAVLRAKQMKADIDEYLKVLCLILFKLHFYNMRVCGHFLLFNSSFLFCFFLIDEAAYMDIIFKV